MVPIAEQLLIRHLKKGLRILVGLKELGKRISTADPGTGYSSPQWLKRLPGAGLACPFDMHAAGKGAYHGFPGHVQVK